MPTTTQTESFASKMPSIYVDTSEMFKEEAQMPQFTFKNTGWYNRYVLQGEAFTNRQSKRFRASFGMPYESFLKLLKAVKVHPAFSFFEPEDDDEESPISILLLGSLSHLKGGRDFDEIEEVTFITEEAHEMFFEKFMEHFENMLGPRYKRH